MFPSINLRNNVRVPDTDDKRRAQEVWVMGQKLQIGGVHKRNMDKRRHQIKPVPVDAHNIYSATSKITNKKRIEDAEKEEHTSYSVSIYDFPTEQTIPIPPESRPYQPRRVVRTRGDVATPFTNQTFEVRPQNTDALPNPQGGCLINAQILQMSNRPGPNRARACFRPNERSVTVQEPVMPTNTDRNMRGFKKYTNRPPVRHSVKSYQGQYTSIPAVPSRLAGPKQYTDLCHCPRHCVGPRQDSGQPFSNATCSIINSPDLDAILNVSCWHV